MRRWIILLGGAAVLVVLLWLFGMLLNDSVRIQRRSRTAALTMRAVPPKIGSENPVALAEEVIREDRVDEAALAGIEREGNAPKTAAAYFLASRHEYEARQLSSAAKFAARAVEFAPDHSGLQRWYAMLLLESGDFSQAIAHAELATRLDPESADALRVLGTAYYDADRLYEAIGSWEAAQAISSDDTIAGYLAKARRELSVEGNFVVTGSSHFLLRYEGGRPAGPLSEDMLRILERQHDDLTQDLGVAPKEPTSVMVYTSQQFFDVTRAPAWAGALNDGKLRIPVGDLSRVTPQLEAVMKHELTHSFVHAAVPRCPVWIQEGLAQMEEGRTFDDFPEPVRAAVQGSGDDLFLRQLEGPFTVFDSARALNAYGKSLAATEYLRSVYGIEGLRRLLTLLAGGKDPAIAIRELTGKDYDDLDQRVGEYLAGRASGR
jgi:tetratricopeptide (TPR) repeat protein